MLVSLEIDLKLESKQTRITKLSKQSNIFAANLHNGPNFNTAIPSAQFDESTNLNGGFCLQR